MLKFLAITSSPANKIRKQSDVCSVCRAAIKPGDTMLLSITNLSVMHKGCA